MAKFRPKFWLTSRGAATLLAMAVCLAVAGPAGSRAAPAALPDRLDDAAFWKLETEISEPGGYFRIADNFTSNEPEIGQVVTMLRERGIRGGAYLGVGPEQNFTYMAAIRPAMAFIVDIRRQAVMQHLMFKAVFELAKDRADFISLLFSKPRPAGLDATSSIQQIWTAYTPVKTDDAAARINHTRIVERLTNVHGFKFTDDEVSQLDWVINAFVSFGPAITTRGSRNYGRGGNNVTFADLTGWSTDAAGQPQSFLSTEDNYQFVKTLQERNLVVPVSGDFGGTKALRGVGAYLESQHAVVSAFYVSNVEQYLFQDGKQAAFYDNVAALPLDERSMFIRPYSLRGRYGRRVEPLCGIQGFLLAFKAGRIFSNNDAQSCMP
jgi:hypothetical protein